MICSANQWTGSNIMGTSVIKELTVCSLRFNLFFTSSTFMTVLIAHLKLLKWPLRPDNFIRELHDGGLNSDSVYIQILFAECWRFLTVSSSFCGPGWKEDCVPFVGPAFCRNNSWPWSSSSWSSLPLLYEPFI